MNLTLILVSLLAAVSLWNWLLERKRRKLATHLLREKQQEEYLKLWAERKARSYQQVMEKATYLGLPWQAQDLTADHSLVSPPEQPAPAGSLGTTAPSPDRTAARSPQQSPQLDDAGPEQQAQAKAQALWTQLDQAEKSTRP